MQILNTQPLIDNFQNDSFKDEAIAPYFIAWTVLGAFAIGGTGTFWDALLILALLPICIFGVLHLKQQNQNSFGNGFLNKHFSLGWVVCVQLFFISIPVVVVAFALAAATSDDIWEPLLTIITIGFEVAFYWRMGQLFALAQPRQNTASQDSPDENTPSSDNTLPSPA